jgi:hypothetical protein
MSNILAFPPVSQSSISEEEEGFLAELLADGEIASLDDGRRHLLLGKLAMHIAAQPDAPESIKKIVATAAQADFGD